jgi:hypothetical protein
LESQLLCCLDLISIWVQEKEDGVLNAVVYKAEVIDYVPLKDLGILQKSSVLSNDRLDRHHSCDTVLTNATSCIDNTKSFVNCEQCTIDSEVSLDQLESHVSSIDDLLLAVNT